MMPKRIAEYETLLNDNPIWRERNVGVAVLPAEDASSWGVTGPVLRASGVATDLRKDMPYSGYETFEFDVPTRRSRRYARYRVRVAEMQESLKIAAGARAALFAPGAVMVADPKIAWQVEALSVGPDGIGNDRGTWPTSWRSRWRP